MVPAIARVPGADELADCCRWVADAQAADDPQQVAAGLCELYRVLTDCGWVPLGPVMGLVPPAC